MSPSSAPEPSPILGLDGKPIKLEDGKRYAIVGSVHVHYLVCELKPGEDMAHAIRTQQIMAQRKDPRLAELTTSIKFFWAEDDLTRDNNRMALLQQFGAFVTSLTPDGKTPARESSFQIVDDMLARSEKGSGDQPPEPTAA